MGRFIPLVRGSYDLQIFDIQTSSLHTMSIEIALSNVFAKVGCSLWLCSQSKNFSYEFNSISNRVFGNFLNLSFSHHLHNFVSFYRSSCCTK